jgi:predicted ATP-grasp superfamily ATP-dependent carboligase/CelD/BcsL family acetyltransferase involved in cellulose biosynthesis
MPLRCSVLTTLAELETLRDAWDELWSKSAADGPMLSPVWLLAWWRAFGSVGRRRLAVLACHDGAALVGFAPFVARTHLYPPGIPFRRLELLGTGEPEADEVCSEHLGILAERGAEELIARATAQAIAKGELGAWDEVVVAPMDADNPIAAALSRELANAGARAELASAGPSYYVELGSAYSAYASRLSPSSRYLLTRSVRDFEAWAGAKVVYHVARTTAELELGKRALVSLHGERWHERGAFGSARFRAFHDEVMAAFLARAELELRWITVGGEPFAAAYDIIANDVVYYYQSGRRLDVPKKIRPGIVLIAHAIREAIDDGRRAFDFFQGPYRYKRELATAWHEVVRLRALRSPDGVLERARTLAEEGKSTVRNVRDAIVRMNPAREMPPLGASREGPERGPGAVLHGDLNMLRCFAGTGVPTVVLASDPDSPSFFSRHCGQRRLVADWRTDPAQAAHDLNELGKLHAGRPVLYYGDDGMLLLVSRHRTSLGGHFRFLLPDSDLVERLVDKVLFAELARELGLPTPRTITSREGLTAEQIARELPLPVILKPFCHLGWRTSNAVVGLGMGPVKALYAGNVASLASMLARIQTFSPLFVVQEHIPGSEGHVYSFHAYVDESRRSLGHFMGRKIRTYPSHAGISTYLELVDEPELANVGFEVLERLAMVGVVKLDFKRHPDTGRFYLLEVNPRYSLWNHLGAAAGVNLPLSAYKDLAGLPVVPAPPARLGTRWLSLADDARTFVRYLGPSGELSLAGWLSSLRGPKVFDVFAWDDPSPFVMNLAHGGRAKHARARPRAEVP